MVWLSKSFHPQSKFSQLNGVQLTTHYFSIKTEWKGEKKAFFPSTRKERNRCATTEPCPWPGVRAAPDLGFGLPLTWGSGCSCFVHFCPLPVVQQFPVRAPSSLRLWERSLSFAQVWHSIRPPTIEATASQVARTPARGNLGAYPLGSSI